MKIGAHLGAYHPDILSPLQDAIKAGYQTVQLFVCGENQYWPHDIPEPTKKAFKQLKQDAGMYVSIHGNYFINCAYNGPKHKLGVSKKSMVEMLKVCDDIGADALCVHPGSFKEIGPNEGMKCLHEVSEQLLNHGFRTKIVWEITAGGGTTVGQVEYLVRVLNNVKHPKLRMCFDTTHAWAAGHDLLDPEARRRLLDQVKPVLEFVHLNMPDPVVNLGSHRDKHHVPWNQGHWPEQTMRVLMEEFKDFPMVMEAHDNSAYSYNSVKIEEWYPGVLRTAAGQS